MLLVAQRFGGNPVSHKWHQTGTDTVSIIYPKSADSLAGRVTAITHRLARDFPVSLGTQVRGINILLQSRPLISNAYVGLAPWRSEFYLTPFQNSLQLGSLPWLDMLAIHEYRHAHQYAQFRKGLSKFAWWLAGEQGQGLANAAAVPDWFFEGDAVDMETILSDQGRGRLPDFFNGYRSLWADGRTYSYMKLRNGSLKHYVPDHYQLGYLLVAAGRERFGPDIWTKITADAAAFSPLFYPFQGAFKRHTGQTFKKFSAQVLSNQMKLPVTTGDSVTSSAEWLTVMHKRNVADHQFPVQIGKDSLLLIRKAYDEVPHWYLLHQGRIDKLWMKDIGIDDYFSYGNGRIVYTAYHPHARWAWQEYNEIMLLEIATGNRRTLSSGGRYFSPGISDDGSLIAAVYVNENGQSELHVLNAEDGRTMLALPNKEGYFHTYPVFGRSKDELLAAVRDREGKMALVAWNLKDQSHQILLPFTNRPIAFPAVKDGFLSFTSSYNGFDRLFLMNLNNGLLYMPSILPPSIRGAVVDTINRSVSYASFTSDGYRIARQPFVKSIDHINQDQWVNSTLPPVFPINKRSASKTLLNTDTILKHEVNPYRQTHRPLNIHSWRAGFEQPEWTFDLYGENLLNTIRTGAYYRYNINEGYHKIGADALIAILYPWVKTGFSVTRDRYYEFSDSVIGGSPSIHWDEWAFNSGISIPLNLTIGRYFKYLNLSAGYQYQGISYRESNTVKLNDRKIDYLYASVNWTMQTPMARQQIFPKWAHSIYLSQRTGISGLAANQFLGSAALYLPGANTRQSIVLNGAWQRRDTLRQYVFSNGFPLSRGYPGIDYPHMWKAGFNYHFTLAYPDFGFLQMAYLLRVRGNLFYDHTWVKSLRQQRIWALRSMGTEIYLDTKWWNQLPVSVGFRYSRLMDTEMYAQKPSANRWEFIMPIGLIPGGPAHQKHTGF